ncbi:D-glycero-alpha-D-manno-heptose-1,7-bisphosphate 7-phosphatase [Candidatus Riflebacteria bacterium]
MPAKKAIFLDRDGTINFDSGYVSCWSDFKFLPGVFEALKLLQDYGFLLYVISNQSGVARGYFELATLLEINEKMRDALRAKDIFITQVYFCPHHPQGKNPEYRQVCECRKPEPGLILQAALEHEIDLINSYCIGDRERDCQAGQAAGCKPILLSKEASTRYPGFPDLLAAAKYIISVEER